MLLLRPYEFGITTKNRIDYDDFNMLLLKTVIFSIIIRQLRNPHILHVKYSSFNRYLLLLENLHDLHVNYDICK